MTPKGRAWKTRVSDRNYCERIDKIDFSKPSAMKEVSEPGSIKKVYKFGDNNGNTIHPVT